MKLEKGMISNSQLMFLVMGFSQSMILTINYNYEVTKQDTWLAVLAAFPIALLTVLLYLVIARRYPGQSLMQINDAVFGRYFGKVFSVIYFCFFFRLIVHYMFFFNSFWLSYIMQETPRAAFLILFALVCGMAVRKGIEVIARCSFLFSVIVGLLVLIVTVLLVGIMKPSNLLPVLDTEPKKFLQSVHMILAIPFCDMIAFLMIVPYVTDQKKIRKPILLGLSLSVAQLLIVVLRDTVVLGPLIANTTFVSFVAARQIDIADIITRLDILVAVAMLITIFMKTTVLYYITALGIAQTLRLRSYLPVVVPIGVIAVAIATNLYPSDMEQTYVAHSVWPFYSLLFQFLIPAITVFVIVVRRLRRKEGAKT